jgi:hypothetical protein
LYKLNLNLVYRVSGHENGVAAAHWFKERNHMTKTQTAIFAGAAVVIAGAIVFATRNNQSAPSTKEGQGTIGARPTVDVTTAAIDPFTHTVSIPATVDPATIRFEKLKSVDLASKIDTTTNAADCKDRQFRDPDGSSCQSVKVVERVKALEADYSYVGPELSSDEKAPGRQNFAVYFRPEEVGLHGPADKLKRDKAAALFHVTTFRSMVEQQSIDKQHSHFCDGNYVDDNWMQKDPNCKDQLQLISQTVPSQNWTVEVDVLHTVASR